MALNECVMNKNIIPTTVRQAFKILDGLTTPEEKKAFLSQSRDDFVGDQHFGLGAWIRNNWIYSADDQTEEEHQRRAACMNMLIDPQGGEPYIIEPDWLTAIFLQRYYAHLKRVARSY